MTRIESRTLAHTFCRNKDATFALLIATDLVSHREMAMRPSMTSVRRQYEQEGFVIVHDLLPASDFRALDDMIDRLLDGNLRPEIPHKGKIPEEFYTFWEPGLKDRDDLPRRERVRLMSWMGLHHPFFWRIDSHPATVAILRDIFASDVKLFSDTVFMKPARRGIEAAPHQDTAFWPKLHPRALNFWLAVDSATIENGCLHVIPRSHHKELPHKEDAIQKWYLDEDQVDFSQQMALELPPNSAVFMDSALVHRSYPNYSDRSRRSMTAVYVSSEVEHLEPWTLESEFVPIDNVLATAPSG